jgi:hypothetical protein
MPTNIPLPKDTEDKGDSQAKQSSDEQRIINSITFFGDSSIPEDSDVYKATWDTAKLLAENGYSIVNGGGPGVMKAATDGAESVDGDTVAVYWEPKLASYFEGKNLANITDESEASSNYMMRTLGLIEKGDAYVVCKGGTGTVSEFGMVWALGKLYYGCHKPVILFGEFWDELIESVQKGMIIDDIELGVLYHATTAEEVLATIKAHEAKLEGCRSQTYSDSDEAAFLLSVKPAQKTIESYDQHGSSYHSQHAGELVSQPQIDEFMSFVNPPAKILDVGTGPGHDAKALSDKYAVTGVEPSKRFVEIARYECPDVKVVHKDFVDYDPGKEIYKGIWARDSLHHIPEEYQDGVFQKLADALVEGGILYVIVREGEGEYVDNERKRYGQLERFYHLYTAKELIARAEKAGLQLVKIDHTKRSHDWLVGVFSKGEFNIGR